MDDPWTQAVQELSQRTQDGRPENLSTGSALCARGTVKSKHDDTTVSSDSQSRQRQPQQPKQASFRQDKRLFNSGPSNMPQLVPELSKQGQREKQHLIYDKVGNEDKNRPPFATLTRTTLVNITTSPTDVSHTLTSCNHSDQHALELSRQQGDSVADTSVVYSLPPTNAKFPFFLHRVRSSSSCSNNTNHLLSHVRDHPQAPVTPKVPLSDSSSDAQAADARGSRIQDSLVEQQLQHPKPKLNCADTIHYRKGSCYHDTKTKQQRDLSRSESSKATTASFHEGAEKLYPFHTLCAHATSLVDIVHAVDLACQEKLETSLDYQGRTLFQIICEANPVIDAVLAATTGLTVNSQQSSRHTANDDQKRPDYHRGGPSSETNVFDLIHYLWKAHPWATLQADHNGKVPFRHVIETWVEEVHSSSLQQYSASHTRMSTATAAATVTRLEELSSFLWRSTSSSFHSRGDANANAGTDIGSGRGLALSGRQSSSLPPSGSEGSNCNCTIAAIQRSEEEPEQLPTCFPTNVQLTPSAKNALVLVSMILDSIEEQEVKLRKELVQTFAKIPDLVKTILLIDNRCERDWCLSTSIMQRVLLNRASVGPWLTSMLQCNDKAISDKALEYLHRISVVKEADHSDLDYAISRLHEFVPSLLSLGETDLEEAATTCMVRRVLDKILSRPFAVTVIICDALFLVLLIWGFRSAVHSLLLVGPSDSESNGSMTTSTTTTLTYIYVANTSIFFFSIRELGKAVSLCMITRQMRVYFWSFWNLTDLLSTLLSMASIITMRAAAAHQSSLQNGQDRTYESEFASQTAGTSIAVRSLLAVTTAFLWLRVLSFLKGMNRQLATFVLAILQITQDILWFCVILLTLVVSFAQIFFTLLAPDSCANVNTNEAMATKRECSRSEYYLASYSILLGDFGTFERDHFTNSISVGVAVLYTFMVVLVLLNVLIAVASDSYEKCLIRSEALFGRARVMMMAELECFQNLLQKTTSKSLDGGDDAVHAKTTVGSSATWIKSWWLVPQIAVGADASGWSRGSRVFFTMSGMVLFGWVLGEVLGYYLSSGSFGDGDSGYKGTYPVYLSFGSILINVTLLLTMIHFLHKSNTEDKDNDKDTCGDNSCEDDSTITGVNTRRKGKLAACPWWQEWIVRFLSKEYRSTVTASSKGINNINLPPVGPSAASQQYLSNPYQQQQQQQWRGRLVFLQEELQQHKYELNQQFQAAMQTLQFEMRQHFAELKTQHFNNAQQQPHQEEQQQFYARRRRTQTE